MIQQIPAPLRAAPPNSRWEQKRSWLSLLMFVIGATSSIDYTLVGRVTVAETIAFAFVPYFWLSGGGVRINANFWRAVALLALMFSGIIIGDFINKTPFLFSARALARPVFMLGFLLFFIAVLKRDPLSLVYMVYGRVLTGIVNYYRPSQFEAEATQDVANYAGVVFRLEPLIAAVALAIAVFIYPRSRILATLSFFGCGALVVAAGGSRSGIIILVSAAAILLAIRFFKSQGSRRIRLPKVRIFGLAAVLTVALTAVYLSYIWAAPRGMLGEEQQQKALEQQKTVFGISPIGFILAGRPQVYGAVLGIMDRPIFGFGSWRHDLTYIYVIDAIASVGTDPSVMDQLSRTGTVGGAGHSVLFQGWIENGFLPAISYIVIFGIMMKVLLFNIRYENRLTPYFVISMIGFSWSFLFSPPELVLRFTVGLFLAFYVVFMDKKRPLARMSLI